MNTELKKMDVNAFSTTSGFSFKFNMHGIGGAEKEKRRKKTTINKTKQNKNKTFEFRSFLSMGSNYDLSSKPLSVQTCATCPYCSLSEHASARVIVQPIQLTV